MISEMKKEREYWIDFVKIFACILVVLGHFFQSMTLSGIIKQTFITEWFDKTIYYFHVPLFFICSGYLYQKQSCINSFADWGKNIYKKAVVLGVPYFVFTLITWLLKTVFSSAVNNEVGSLFSAFFIKPIAPYWYLYALFFLFLITPTAKNKKIMLYFLGAALLLKCVSFLWTDTNVYALNVVLANEIWFVIGMSLKAFDTIKQNKVWASFVTACIFIILSFLLYRYSNTVLSFIMGLLGCAATIMLAVSFKERELLIKICRSYSKYTLPVFLMHTIFAAALRSVLLKVGIDNIIIHFILGIGISFIGPIIATIIMQKIKGMDFLLYPNKYINRG